jgi:hypothetical protein
MPSTTNLGIVTPTSNDFVTNGATAMTTMADDIDAYFGAPTTYTPTTTNITGGTVTGRFTRMGKLGIISIGISAGTATAAGTVSCSLPSGWTTAGVSQVLPAFNGTALISVNAAASSSTVTIRADATGNNWTLGASVVGVRINGWLFLT